MREPDDLTERELKRLEGLKSPIQSLWAGSMNQPVRTRFKQIEEQIKDGKMEKGPVAQDKPKP